MGDNPFDNPFDNKNNNLYMDYSFDDSDLMDLIDPNTYAFGTTEKVKLDGEIYYKKQHSPFSIEK